MNNIKNENNLTCCRKVLPGLGGIRKKYIRKPICIKVSLNYIGDKLDDVIKKSKLEENDKVLYREIIKDIKYLANYEKMKTQELYFETLNIIRKYNSNNIFDH